MSILSGLGMLPFYIIFPLVGMAIRLTLGEHTDPKDVTYLFIDRHSTQFILGFAIVGLLSALMSSGDSFLNLISISAIKDFWGWRKKNQAEKKMHFSIRIATFIFGIFAMIMALIFPRIVDLMVVGIGTIVIFVPVTFLALTNKHADKYFGPAIISILSGFFVNLCFFIWGVIAPQQFEPKSSFIPAFIVAAISLWAGVKMKAKRV